jgi:tape measure domain-containing protein
VADAQLKAVITAEDRASKVIAGVSSSLEQTQTRLQKLTPYLKSIGAAGLVAGGALAVLGKNAISAAADYEQSQIAFTTMLGSAEKANVLLQQLSDFGKKTPFELPGLIEASKKLLAFGIAQEQIIPTLRQLGDIAAGVGIPVNELAEIYGKAQVQGRLFAEDVNQLTGRGIPVIQEFAKQFGVTEGEVRKLVESGAIGFPQLQKAFADLTSEGSKFGGLMDAQSASFSGMLSNFQDGIGEMMRQLGAVLLPYAKGVLEELNKILGEIPGWVETVISQMSDKINQGISMWQSLRESIRNFKDEIAQSEAVINILNILKDTFAQVWDQIKNQLSPAFSELWNTVKNSLFPALQELWAALQPLAPYFQLMATVVGGVLLVSLILLIDAFTKIVMWVAKVLEIWAKAVEWIIRNGSPAIKAFADEIGGLVQKFMDVVNWVDKAISKVSSFASSVSKVNLNPFSSGFNIPGLPGRAGGGAVGAGQPFMVGERGPELFVPQTYGSITKNSQLSGGGGVNIVVYGDVSGQELIETVKKSLMKELKFNTQI